VVDVAFCFMPGVRHQSKLVPDALAPHLKIDILDNSCKHVIHGYKYVSINTMNQLYIFEAVACQLKNLTIIVLRAPFFGLLTYKSRNLRWKIFKSNRALLNSVLTIFYPLTISRSGWRALNIGMPDDSASQIDRFDDRLEWQLGGCPEVDPEIQVGEAQVHVVMIAILLGEKCSFQNSNL
jgi:hypothetical protein